METAGVDDVEEDASAALGVGSFLGLAASAFCFASSRVPNISVKTVSRDSLISATLAHLGYQLARDNESGSSLEIRGTVLDPSH